VIADNGTIPACAGQPRCQRCSAPTRQAHPC